MNEYTWTFSDAPVTHTSNFRAEDTIRRHLEALPGVESVEIHRELHVTTKVRRKEDRHVAYEAEAAILEWYGPVEFHVRWPS